MYSNIEDIFIFVFMIVLIIFSVITMFEINTLSFSVKYVNKINTSSDVTLPVFNKEIYFKSNKSETNLNEIGNIFILKKKIVKVKKIVKPENVNKTDIKQDVFKKAEEPAPIYFITGYRKSSHGEYLYIKNVEGDIKKVKKGDSLDDGFKVKEIKKYIMVIEKNGKEYKFKK